MRRPVKIGVGGPVGSGKTALLDCLCKAMRDRYQIGVVTNDIFTREDMEFLVRSNALPAGDRSSTMEIARARARVSPWKKSRDSVVIGLNVPPGLQ